MRLLVILKEMVYHYLRLQKREMYLKLNLLRDLLPVYPITILSNPHLIQTISWSSALLSSPLHLQIVTDTLQLLAPQHSLAPPLPVSECLLAIYSYFLFEVAVTCACLPTGNGDYYVHLSHGTAASNLRGQGSMAE